MSSETPDVLTEQEREALTLALFKSKHLRAALAFGVPQEAWEDCRQGIADAILEWHAARVAAERERADAAEYDAQRYRAMARALNAAEAKVAAVEALAEEATQRAYMQIARDRMLAVMPIDAARTRAVVPDHWRAEAEEAASVPVTDLLAALGGEATP